MADRAGRRGRFDKFADGVPKPCKVGLLIQDKRGPPSVLPILGCDGEGSIGDDEFSCWKTRGASGETGESERRFLGLGLAGSQKTDVETLCDRRGW